MASYGKADCQCFCAPVTLPRGSQSGLGLLGSRAVDLHRGATVETLCVRSAPLRRGYWLASVPDLSEAEVKSPEVLADARTLSAASSSQASSVLTVDEIMKILPHRYPFLLVDKVLHYESGKRAVALKNVTINEPFFQGHFPDRPIMPGVLQIEALAQTGGIVMRDLIKGEDGNEKRDFFFGGVDNVRWRKPVTPGDSLYMEVTLTSYKARFGIAKLVGKAYVDGQVACEADLTLVVDVRGKSKS